MEKLLIELKETLVNAKDILASIGITDILDILFIAFLIYELFTLIRRTNSKNIAKGMFILFAVYALCDILEMKMMMEVLNKAIQLGLIALVILFQPELRRLFERIGGSLKTGKDVYSGTMESAVAQTVLASTEMSSTKTGALIIFERNNQLNDIMSTGTIINADATAELIKNIFFNKAPLHDGALIIRDGRLAAAGCVLPLTKSKNLSKDLGMRHRAGIGLSEQSDALVIIVSEETGSISVAIEGMLKRHLSAASLERILRTELIPESESTGKTGLFPRILNIFTRNNNEK